MLRNPLFKLSCVIVVIVLAACDDRRTVASLGPSCSRDPVVSPTSATIRVGESINIAMTIGQGCPAPIALNDTPTLLDLVSPSVGVVRVTGRAAGAGRVRFRSSVDTLVSLQVPVTVNP